MTSRDAVAFADVESIAMVELYPGVRKRTIFDAGPPAATRVLILEIDPGRGFLDVDTHDAGPEEIYVLEGAFHDGTREYPAGSIIHYPKGTSHVPQSASGCRIMVFLPQG